jgi:hypothetical protein
MSQLDVAVNYGLFTLTRNCDNLKITIDNDVCALYGLNKKEILKEFSQLSEDEKTLYIMKMETNFNDRKYLKLFERNT